MGTEGYKTLNGVLRHSRSRLDRYICIEQTRYTWYR